MEEIIELCHNALIQINQGGELSKEELVVLLNRIVSISAGNELISSERLTLLEDVFNNRPG